MKKKYLLLSGFAISAAGVTSYLLRKGSNRTMAKMMANEVIEKIIPFMKKDDVKNLPVKKAGHPDPYDYEDTKMVEEGSVYPVNYYNKKQ
ncbi:hypothetical protein [Fictibacillus enclensis]|uniref:hypothetical protein n=1 Tax=Fictibacillus enclensis TaxID=1017270 RepID=UPI0024C018E9|nr:hypothetical protein [Fictibacillus enclensis]WHY74155.1 hypothetical protein QNH15_09705 [Fictibacillus enclensis]